MLLLRFFLFFIKVGVLDYGNVIKKPKRNLRREQNKNKKKIERHTKNEIFAPMFVSSFVLRFNREQNMIYTNTGGGDFHSCELLCIAMLNVEIDTIFIFFTIYIKCVPAKWWFSVFLSVSHRFRYTFSSSPFPMRFYCCSAYLPLICIKFR